MLAVQIEHIRETQFPRVRSVRTIGALHRGCIRIPHSLHYQRVNFHKSNPIWAQKERTQLIIDAFRTRSRYKKLAECFHDFLFCIFKF